MLTDQIKYMKTQVLQEQIYKEYVKSKVTTVKQTFNDLNAFLYLQRSLSYLHHLQTIVSEELLLV